MNSQWESRKTPQLIILEETEEEEEEEEEEEKVVKAVEAEEGTRTVAVGGVQARLAMERVGPLGLHGYITH